jgi:hypothetical protein
VPLSKGRQHEPSMPIRALRNCLPPKDTPACPPRTAPAYGLRTMCNVHRFPQRTRARRCSCCGIPLSTAPARHRWCGRCWRYRRLRAALTKFAGSRA